MTVIQILEWKPLRKGSLLGFAKIKMPSGMILSDVTVLQGGRGAWASPPAKPLIDRDGMVQKDANGKTKYASLVEFTSKEIRDKFSNAVIDGLRASHPDAFG